MIFTSVFDRVCSAVLNDSIRTVVNEGGTWSSKTFSILQALDLYCMQCRRPLLCSVVSESFPHLRLGAMRDFRAILGDRFDESKWLASEHIYKYGEAQIEFFSADQPGKAHGPRRDVLFLNEAINIPKVICDQLIIRTRWKVLIDHNPCQEYWAHDLKERGDVAWIHSTYKDALDVVPAEVVQDIESRKDKDQNWWRVYGLGLVGNIEGLVHPQFDQVDTMPEGGIDFYGLDFGFTNDPTALIHCRIIGDDLYSDEVIYETGLNNQAIVQRMESAGIRKGYDEIFADCAEPKSIDEIRLRGFNIKPCPKGPDSVTAGIQRVNQYRQHWTKRSPRSIKEQRNYSFIKTMDGKITNKPIDGWGHSMDARRYAVFGKLVEVKPQMVLL